MLPLLHDLKELTHLDITQNKLKIDGFLLDSLFSLPKLEKLEIDGTEAEFERILENLPNLQVLNKKKIVRKKNNNALLERKKKQMEMLGFARQELLDFHSEIMSQF